MVLGSRERVGEGRDYPCRAAFAWNNMLATFAWLNGMTQGILDGINQVTVETLNLVVAGQQQGGHGQQGQY